MVTIRKDGSTTRMPGDEETLAAQHTPGPWYLSDGFISTAINGDEMAIAQMFVRVENHFPKPIGGSEAEMFTNARLIAAAPDLLDACKNVRDRFVGTIIGSESWFTKIEAAIAKAEGRTP